jgi:hypothetical protein
MASLHLLKGNVESCHSRPDHCLPSGPARLFCTRDLVPHQAARQTTVGRDGTSGSRRSPRPGGQTNEGPHKQHADTFMVEDLRGAEPTASGLLEDVVAGPAAEIGDFPSCVCDFRCSPGTYLPRRLRVARLGRALCPARQHVIVIVNTVSGDSFGSGEKIPRLGVGEPEVLTYRRVALIDAVAGHPDDCRRLAGGPIALSLSRRRLPTPGEQDDGENSGQRAATI